MSEAPAEVVALAESRLQARAAKDWAQSDLLRDEIAKLGWVVSDSAGGYALAPKPPFSVLPNLAAIADRSQESSAPGIVVDVVVDGWPEDVRTFFAALLAHMPVDAHVVAVDAGNVDGAGIVLEEFVSIDNRVEAIHLQQDLQSLGWAAVRNALIRYSPADIHVILDLSTILSGDAITPLADAVCGGAQLAGWRGVNVNLEDNWRSFNDARSAGEVDAVLSYLLVVDRDAAVAQPIDAKARFYRNADLEWSLDLRANGAKVVMPTLDLPCTQARHHGYHDTDPEYRDRESKRTYDRLLQKHRGKTSQLAPR